MLIGKGTMEAVGGLMHAKPDGEGFCRDRG